MNKKMKKRKKVGIFGSAFNPPTLGHLNAFMQQIDNVDEIWLVPSYAHAFGKNPLSFEVRCKLLSVFIENINNSKIKISEIERDFFNSKDVDYVYTYELLVFLKEKYQDCDFKFICGEDNAIPSTWSKFKNHNEIDNEFGKLVSKEIVDIRSTYVREACETSDYKKLKDYMFENIIEYIKENNLYK